ncbi:MAG: substrate-binding domain-containing protein [Motiliproteus sp.]
MTTALRTFLSLLLCLPLGVASPLLQADTLRLATTTSTANSGLLEAILPEFQRLTGTEVQVIAVGTGAALRMGRDGDVDVLLVHAPNAEQTFVDLGYGQQRTGVMYNDFVLVGPTSDPAQIRAQPDATSALRQIAERGALFISRGDDSGTHKKEKQLWQLASTAPAGNGYREAGQGMGKVLQISSEMGAYTLTDRGTWLAYANKVDLELLLQGDPRLFNPYSVIQINPQRFPDLNHQAAAAFRQWLVSKPTQQRIADFRINNQPLFVPSATSAAGSLSDLTDRSERKTDLRQFSNSFEANSGSIKRKIEREMAKVGLLVVDQRQVRQAANHFKSPE